MAPTGSDKNLCTQAAPCLTIDRAYKTLAPGGGSVLLASGSYGLQSVARIAAKANDTVRTQIKPEPGATVKLGHVLLSADHVQLSGLTINGYNIYGVDVQILNVVSTDAIYITGARDVSVLGGEVFSPVPVSSDPMITSRYGTPPTNVTLDGVWFHDFLDVGPGNYHHIECLQVGAGENLTIRNSRFGPNCDTHDLFIRSWGNNTNGSPHPLNVHIENNLFEKCDVGCYALMADDDLYTLSPTSIELKSNTFEPGTGWSFDWSHGKADAYGNLLPKTSAFNCGYHAVPAGLRPNAIFHDNLWYGPGTGVGCGTNAMTIPDTTGLWAGNGNYHLASGSPAIDRFTVGSASDFEGDSRPQGGLNDAGADERLGQDKTAPVLVNMPGNTIAEATGPGGATVVYTGPTATDNLDPRPTVTCVPVSSSMFPLGSRTVTCTATDASGNSSAGTFPITVRDSTAPSAPGNPTPSNATRTSVDLSWTSSTDAVGPTGYDLWLDAVPAGSTTGSRFTFGGLLCGTAHTLTVAAHDAAGNLSQQGSAYVSSLSCPSPPPTTTPPPTPTTTTTTTTPIPTTTTTTTTTTPAAPLTPRKLAESNSVANPATAAQTLRLSAVRAGDTVVAVVFGNANRPSSVRDSLGNAYVLDAASGAANTLSSTSTYHYRYPAAQSSLSLSVNWSGAIVHQQVAVYAIPGLSAVPLDARVTSGAKSATPSISTSSTTKRNEVAIAAFRVMESNWMGSGLPPAGWTVLTSALAPSGNGHMIVAYRPLPTTGPMSFGFNLGATASNWSGVLTTYAGG